MKVTRPAWSVATTASPMLVKVVCNKSRLAVVRLFAASRSTISRSRSAVARPISKVASSRNRNRTPAPRADGQARSGFLLLPFANALQQAAVDFVLQVLANLANIVHGVLAAIGLHHGQRGFESFGLAQGHGFLQLARASRKSSRSVSPPGCRSAGSSATRARSLFKFGGQGGDGHVVGVQIFRIAG